MTMANGAANGTAADANGVFKSHTIVLILDYGSQYTQLIARRVREAGVCSLLMPGDASMVCTPMEQRGA